MMAIERTDPSAVDPATRRELARVDILAAVRALSGSAYYGPDRRT